MSLFMLLFGSVSLFCLNFYSSTNCVVVSIYVCVCVCKCKLKKQKWDLYDLYTGIGDLFSLLLLFSIFTIIVIVVVIVFNLINSYELEYSSSVSYNSIYVFIISIQKKKTHTQTNKQE